MFECEKPLRLLGAGCLALALASCGDSEKDHRGFDYFPDMYDQPAYRSQQAQIVEVEVGDGKVAIHQTPMMLTPPPGTISRDFVPYQIDAADFASARLLENPLAASAAVLKEGQTQFNTFCVVCHGNDGNAVNGYVAKYFVNVPSLNGANIAQMPDGEIFHIVTNGRGRMPNYRAQLLPAQRWAVVHYLRALNRATIATSDAAAMLKQAEDAVAKAPEDAKAKTDLEAARKAIANAKRDQDLIQQGGDGAEFKPRAAPLPEYIKPTWSEK